MENLFMLVIVILIYGVIALSTFFIVLSGEQDLNRQSLAVAVFWGALWPVFYTAALILRFFMCLK